jgi:endogenous inhibitor of DNA gyrase (YacG/DUF329 family)
MYGETGVLATDGEKVQCHECGRWFKRLIGHIKPAHGLDANEYKEAFGINQTTSLMSPAQREIMREATAEVLARNHALGVGAEVLRSMTYEERAEVARRKRRPETKKKPENQAIWRRGIKKAHARLMEMYESGEYTPSGWPASATEEGHKALARLREDPEWREQWAANISEARGGLSFEIRTCPWCGTEFEELTYGHKTFCSDECRLANLSRRLKEENVMLGEEGLAKIREHAAVAAKVRGRTERGTFDNTPYAHKTKWKGAT